METVGSNVGSVRLQLSFQRGFPGLVSSLLRIESRLDGFSFGSARPQGVVLAVRKPSVEIVTAGDVLPMHRARHLARLRPVCLKGLEQLACIRSDPGLLKLKRCIPHSMPSCRD